MVDNPSYGTAILSQHARVEFARRGIADAEVKAVLEHPGRQAEVRPGRIVLTTLREGRPGVRAYVLRVFVDIDRSPRVVVTAYRSSKIGKYWSQP
ncbi:MAG: DUF4258 domain-containing protein [Thermoflexaceae bacterium]|nr:DUF4258 domain-containing protein [Thermoflexaceae bacterium]